MNTITIIVHYFVIVTVILQYAASKECPPGTFLHRHTGENICRDCQDGTFMPYKDHSQTACIPCEEMKVPMLEFLVSPCNKTHDAVIHCVDGYSRDPPKMGHCKKCTECKSSGQSCSTNSDTVCCQSENFDVVIKDHGVRVCKKRPWWFCRRGQYFDTMGYQCLPCPDNKFMPIDYHIQPECWKCREYDKIESYRYLHSVIIQPCNSTHAPVIRCKDGFFMDSSMGYNDSAQGCSPCTDCSTTDVKYEGRKCDGMEDTVCCPQPNMTVVKAPDSTVRCHTATMISTETPEGLRCSLKVEDSLPTGSVASQALPFETLFYLFFAASFFLITFLVVTAILNWRRKRRRRRKRTVTTPVDHIYSEVDENI